MTQINNNLHTLNAILEKESYLNKLKFTDETVRLETKSFSAALKEPIIHLLHIRYKSFLDEYKFFNISKTMDLDLSLRIEKIRKLNSFGTTYIENKWKDLHKFRNIVSAHYFRDKNKDSIFENGTFEYSIPYYFVDHKIIFYIFEKMYKNICSEFIECEKTFSNETLEAKITFKKRILFFEKEKQLIDLNM